MARYTRMGEGAPSDYEQQIIDNVDEYGWFCVSVFEKHDAPGFSYSVGFWKSLGAPECIIFGQPTKLAHSMLWRVYRQIQGGAVLADGGRWSDLIEGFDCVSRPVHPSQVVRDYFNSAMWFWGDPETRGGEVSAYQLFWPGTRDGIFPWEKGCADIVRELQPALYLPRAVGLA